MQSDNSGRAADKVPESDQDTQVKTVEWLLEQDMSEPEDRLFQLGFEVSADDDLTELETAMAGRPMFQSNGGADDLSAFVEEEIVIGDVGGGSDIYADKPGDGGPAAGAMPAGGRVMAIDHRRRRQHERPASDLADGVDILGLSDDDDIGSQPISLQRKPAAKPAAPMAPPRMTTPEETLSLDNEVAAGPETPAAESPVGDVDELPPALDLSGLELEGPAGAIDSLSCDDPFTMDADAGCELDMTAEAPAVDEPVAEDAADSDLETLEAAAVDTAAVDTAAGEFPSGAIGDAPEFSGYLSDSPAPDEAPVGAEPGALDISSWAAGESWLEPEPADEVSVDEVSSHTHAVSLPEEPQDNAESGSWSYSTATGLPTCDDEFDRYLLSADHSTVDGGDIDALELTQSEGVTSVDPSLEADLDYHQDFRLPQDVRPETVAALAALVDPAMDALQTAVAAQLQKLGAEAGSVALDAMLTTDPLSRRRAVEEGYLPVSQVMPELPEALQALDEEARDALCVCLVWRDSGHTANEILQPGYAFEQSPAQGQPEMPAAFPGIPLPESGSEVSFPTSAASANDAGPEAEDDADFLASFLDGELGSAGTSDDAADLWALLDEESDSRSWVQETGLAEPDPAEPLLAEPAPAEPARAEPEKAADKTPADSENTAAAPAASVFDLNLFNAADELDDWQAADQGPAEDSDLDALMDSLSPEEADIEDLLGSEMVAFASAPDEAEPEPPPEVHAAAPVPADAAATQSDAGGHWCIPAHIRFSFTSSSGTEVFRDFLDAFLEEGAVELEKLEDAIGEWEQALDSPAGSDVVPRVLHTLKGIAKGVGLQRYGTLIHNFETLLQGLARPLPGEEAAYFRIINAWLDAAIQGFEHIQDAGEDVASELPQLARVAGVSAGADNTRGTHDDSAASLAVHPLEPAPRIDRQQDAKLADEGAKVLAAQQTIRMSSESLDHLLNLGNQAQQLGVRASQSTFKSKRAAVELLARLSSVRSHITKIADRALQSVTAKGSQGRSELDALEMDQYSELQEAANILREGIEDLDDLIHVSTRQTASAEALLKQQASVVTSLSSALRDARVVPVSRLMPGLRRIVRNVGDDLGKAVEFRVLNEVGKLDRDSHVCCQIILEHMVRNALDHGIELPQDRIAAGKPESGRITVDVRKDGADYVIRLADDGRGMDPDALREAALDRGLDLNIAELSDRDALRLIFHKGFSTAGRVSEISGRGVGMDIVLSELQQIGGEIDIESTPGVGTTFIVRVPSNVNVNGALLVSAGDASYAIPLDGLVATERVPVEDFYRAIAEGGNLSLFGIECEPAYLATLCHGEKLPEQESWTGNSIPVIIAGDEDRHMAIAVDDVTEALELVIRSLGPQFSGVPGVAGGATTSDGHAIVALDLNLLVRSIADSGRSAVALEREREQRLLVLVVDDSRTQRMVATSQFDTLGVETVTAENGLVAIDLLNSTHRLPDVILLDVEMPVKDGIQTLREIRRSARYRHLPVIMVTSRTGPKHRALAREAGCNGYMGKPFNFPVLVEQIAQLTGQPLSIN